MHVADDGTAALAVDVIVNGMTKDFGLVGGSRIDIDFGVAGAIHEPILRRRISGLLIEHVIIRSVVAGRLGLV